MLYKQEDRYKMWEPAYPPGHPSPFPKYGLNK